MNPFRRLLSLTLVATTLSGFSLLADPAPSLSASELASKLSELRDEGASYVRLKMEIKGAKAETLQIQIKERHLHGSSEIVYQVLFPKERKGESVLLRRVDNHPASGSLFIPPNTVRPISDLKEPLLGSDLSCEDIINNPYAWEHQALVGNETVSSAACQILESKPGKSDHSTFGSVRSWIDPRRMVPLRIEEYSASGQLLRRIDTTRVVADGARHIPADLVVHGPHADSSTIIDGSRLKHDVTYSDADFSIDGLKQITVPGGAP